MKWFNSSLKQQHTNFRNKDYKSNSTSLRVNETVSCLSMMMLTENICILKLQSTTEWATIHPSLRTSLSPSQMGFPSQNRNHREITQFKGLKRTYMYKEGQGSSSRAKLTTNHSRNLHIISYLSNEMRATVLKSGYSDTLWHLNFSRTVAGITKWFWVTIEELPPAKIWRLSSH